MRYAGIEFRGVKLRGGGGCRLSQKCKRITLGFRMTLGRFRFPFPPPLSRFAPRRRGNTQNRVRILMTPASGSLSFDRVSGTGMNAQDRDRKICSEWPLLFRCFRFCTGRLKRTLGDFRVDSPAGWRNKVLMNTCREVNTFSATNYFSSRSERSIAFDSSANGTTSGEIEKSERSSLRSFSLSPKGASVFN